MGEWFGVFYFIFDFEVSGVFIFYDDMKIWVFMKLFDLNMEFV